MARRPTTVRIDEALLDAARTVAEQRGTTADEVIEEALRRHLALVKPSVVDEVWARQSARPLSAEEAMNLAYAELDAFRAERRANSEQVRLVVDPGVLVSALITPLGTPARLWQAARVGRVQLIVSPRLLAELAGVLERDNIRPYVSLEEGRQFVAEVTDLADAHDDPETIPKMPRDPKADYLVALAKTAGSEAIVSGDRDLTERTDLDPPVLTPSQVLDRLANEK